MSSFARMDCATCKEETIHRFSVCTKCKTVRKTPSEVRREAEERIAARAKTDRKFRRQIAHARNRKWFDKAQRNSAYGDPRSNSEPAVFDRGFERTKA